MGRLTVIIRGQQLTVGHRQYGFSGNGGGIYIIGQELKLAVQPLLLLHAIEVVDGKCHFFITLALPEVALIRRIIVLMLYHLPHKLHSRVILLFVAFALRLHQHLVQRVSGRSERNFYTLPACRMNQPGVFIVSHSRDYQPCFRAIGFERKYSPVISHSPLCGSFQIDRGIRQRFPRQRISDNTLHHILRPQGNRNYLHQQKYPNKQPHTLPIYHSVRKGTEENFF